MVGQVNLNDPSLRNTLGCHQPLRYTMPRYAGRAVIAPGARISKVIPVCGQNHTLDHTDASWVGGSVRRSFDSGSELVH